MYAADRIGRKLVSGNSWYSHKSEGSLPNRTLKLLEGLVSLSSVLSGYYKIEVIAIIRVSTLLLRLSPWIAAISKNRMDLYGLVFLLCLVLTAVCPPDESRFAIEVNRSVGK